MISNNDVEVLCNTGMSMVVGVLDSNNIDCWAEKAVLNKISQQVSLYIFVAVPYQIHALGRLVPHVHTAGLSSRTAMEM